MVPIMESVLGGLEPRDEAWECVNELEPGLALRGQAVPLRSLALRLARRWGWGVCDLVLSMARLPLLSGPAVSSIWHNLALERCFLIVPKVLYK